MNGQKIEPQVARDRANEMRQIADRLEELLKQASNKMSEVNDGETEMYDGFRNPETLRGELNQFGATFHLTHEQIKKSAGDIIATANTMENQ